MIINFQKTRTLPFHIVLLPVFFIFHTINEYFGEFGFASSLPFFFYYIGLALLLFICGSLFFKNAIRAGCWTTLLLIIFFFYGAAHDFLKKELLPPFLLSYTFILPFLLILIVVLTIWIKGKNRPFVRTSIFLNLLFGLLLLSELLFFTINTISRHNNTKAVFLNKPIPISADTIDPLSKPDIFFIVLDEYASTLSLKKYLNYDNTAFDSILRDHRFYIVNKSQSNYNVTAISLASTLNMSYFNFPMENQSADPHLTMRASNEIGTAEVVKTLQKLGYTFKNYGLFNIEGHNIHGHTLFYDTPARAFYLQTLYGRIASEIWWHFSLRMNPSFGLDAARVQVDQNLYNLGEITRELKTEDSIPKFVFGHLLMPHTPLYFDRHGKPLAKPSYEKNTIQSDSLYIGQLIYTNKLISDMIGNIHANKRPRIIIIEGDHGYRDTKPGGIREKQFMNLNAWYLSDGDYSMLYDSISPVNSFRIVLNKYFDAHLPLLKDSTIDLNH